MPVTVTSRRLWVGLSGLVALAAIGAGIFVIGRGGSGAGESAATSTHTILSRWDWPTYGHDAQHSFAGRTTLTEATVHVLRPAWSFPTGDAVTATPTVVGGTVYVGSWDGFFYAIDLRTGQLRWKFQLN
ncbi:MAG TPA: PQQ-binding-like beta-propeller repeat protein, partial [Acidimicrobiales bacterium]|nr:PQQ-binding-like beta-propeller repeat protein [Acidimicrobiales bacterium]